MKTNFYFTSNEKERKSSRFFLKKMAGEMEKLKEDKIIIVNNIQTQIHTHNRKSIVLSI